MNGLDIKLLNKTSAINTAKIDNQSLFNKQS